MRSMLAVFFEDLLIGLLFLLCFIYLLSGGAQ